MCRGRRRRQVRAACLPNFVPICFRFSPFNFFYENGQRNMPTRSKRQAQSQAASQNAKLAHENAAKNTRECYQNRRLQRFPPSVHFSIKGKTCAPVAARFQTAASVFTVETAGGITAAGAQLHLEDPTLRIATVIASNSGWPGGACRDISGEIDKYQIHDHHYTQEEDIVSNWLLTASECWLMRSRHFARISGSFGLRSPEGTDTATKQGIDYTTSGVMGARIYADAWCCQGARLSDKRVTGTAAARFDTTRTYPTTLVFCAGPNAQKDGPN
jgi:hypothetical protein